MLDDVGGLAGRLLDLLLEVLAEPVVRHAAMHLDAEVRHVAELHRVVLAAPDRLGEVLADLVGVDVERRRELDVADVVAAEVDVHETRHEVGRVGVLVVLDALDERGGAVADADDRDAYLVLVIDSAVAGAVGRAVLLAHLNEASCGIHAEKGGLSRGFVTSPYPETRSPVTSPASGSSPASCLRTCQMRWPTVNGVSAAIT